MMTILTTLTAALLLGLLLAIFAVLLPTTIVFNTRAGMKYRKVLAEKVDKLRLGRMLAALGIDIDVYLSSARAVDIRDQIENCKACVNTRECDDKLAGGAIGAGDIGFCNNEESLKQVAKDQH
ncbi:MAG: DUF6455 family protein [Gammaproteobacteria bacterium]|jgi:hypothetical protein